MIYLRQLFLRCGANLSIMARAAVPVLVLALMLTFISCTRTPPPTPVEKTTYVAPVAMPGNASKNERFTRIMARASQVGQCDTLVIGDSIVEGLHKKYFDSTIFTAGIQSSGVNDWLAYAPALLDTIKPKTVILALGVNDARMASSRLPDFVNGYSRLCRTIRDKGPELIVSTVLPIRTGRGKGTRLGNNMNPATISRMNSVITNIARENGYGVIDSYKAMADSRGLLPQVMTFDGVHLTKEGYVKWETVLFSRRPSSILAQAK